ncbi:hypothetical protein PILCRDRAFT_382208 [Piloderma croceum F 1598]|uniref:Uncharacterized protein n=1 Tax=Piloderma croceum (strain F 1598) TaxID=765440 RepID=A0A0C3C661_PILCF|nr:hypothetical protein PILCRDRAFT_382208 [Piloderma croceum F 1598]
MAEKLDSSRQVYALALKSAQDQTMGYRLRPGQSKGKSMKREAGDLQSTQISNSYRRQGGCSISTTKNRQAQTGYRTSFIIDFQSRGAIL